MFIQLSDNVTLWPCFTTASHLVTTTALAAFCLTATTNAVPPAQIAAPAYRCVDGHCAVALEDGCDEVERVLPDGHLIWQEVTSTLGDLGLAAGLVLLLLVVMVVR